MRSPIHALKVATSGLLFLLLGVGGVLCTLVLRPLLALLPAHRSAIAQRVIRLFFRAFVLALEGSGILKVDAALPPAADLRGAVVLANHPSYLDIVVLIALLPGSVCVVKPGVWNNPFFGPLVRAAGFIPALEPERLLPACAQVLAAGRTLVIFPEGTRTEPGAPYRFHRGAAHVALSTGAPLRPLLVRVDPPLLAKGDRWYHIPAATARFRITPLAAEAAMPVRSGARPAEARALTRALEALYTEGCRASGSDRP